MNEQQAYWAAQGGDAYWQEYLTADKHAVSELLVETIREHCKVSRKALVHELGCGIGRNMDHIADAFPAWSLSGNDINLALAKGRFEGATGYAHIQIRNGHIFQYFSFPSEDWVRRWPGQPFHILLSCAHFIHVPDMTPFQVWAEKQIRKGGYLVLYESAGTLEAKDKVHWEQQVPAWYDRDYADVFADTPLQLVHRARHRSFRGVGTRAYDVYVFRNGGGK